MMELILREAQDKDFKEIADLCNQLGYPTDSGEIPLRLHQIRSLEQHAIFVAVLEQQVVGWIHIYLCPLLISPLQAQLGGLVVDSNRRGLGIGSKLMHQAETWAFSHSCKYLTIFTNITRIETQFFYKHLGYQTIKTELVMRKEINGGKKT
jgi:GNAT superfamily N-acetyltransferase